jgi:hypothetical protein
MRLTMNDYPGDLKARPLADAVLRTAAIVSVAALADAGCVLWVNPVAARTAELAGMPILRSVHFGINSMIASIPVVLTLTTFALLRLVRRHKKPSKKGLSAPVAEHRIAA